MTFDKAHERLNPMHTISARTIARSMLQILNTEGAIKTISPKETNTVQIIEHE